MSKVKKGEEYGQLAYVFAAREIPAKTVEKKALIQYYASCCNNEGNFYRSLVSICSDLCVTEAFVVRTNAAWKELGILSWTEGNFTDNRANHYQLHLSKMQQLVANGAKELHARQNKIREQNKERARRWRAAHKPVTHSVA